VFDQEEQVWIWKYQGHDLHIDVGEDIRFRVVKVQYESSSSVSSAAMTVYGSIAGDGLGLVSWWPN
jgi:DNA-directed RNA polymerase III subunit RPC8